TQSGDILGTMRYMSPEQASGQRLLLDHRTDIYSLGVTLYELATLEPIFAGSSRHRLIHQITHDEPRTPRAVDKTVPVELETIILKAISKSPTDRYATAREFADDLQRFLDEEPILARRPSLLDHVRKWRRRHPAAVPAAVVVLLACIGVLSASNRLIQKEQERTQVALQQERLRAIELRETVEEAEMRYRQARQAVDLLIQVCEEELANQPGMQGLRRRLLETALVNYADFVQQRRDNPKAQAELSELTAEQNRVQRILEDLKVMEQRDYLSLIAYREVQADLELSDEASEEITKLSAKWASDRDRAFRRFHDMPAESKRSRQIQQYRSQERALALVLSLPQQNRLRQILLQVKGPFAFRDHDIVSALKLTSNQREAIREATTKALSSLWMPPRPGVDPTKRHQEAMASAVERILRMLSNDQASKWQELVGDPFENASQIRLTPLSQF
ncbi:MAG: protein kinase, partial [Planctomycetia bacterium]|nr:protein kinase [Planctomycetia bacterium]